MPKICTARVSISITNSTYTRRSSTVSTCRKSQARMPDAWATRNCRQVGDARRGAGRARQRPGSGGSSPPPPGTPGRPARLECAGTLSAGSPTPVAPQARGPPPDRRASRSARVRPLPLDKASVPGQQGARSHDPVQPQLPRQQPRQGGEHGTVSPVRPRPGNLTTQHRDLMPEHQDLGVLGSVASRKERQPAERPDHEQVDEANEHERRA
jgi:hypothetical protein